MNVIIINTITISVVLPVVGSAHFVVQTPCRLVVGLDGGLHGQSTQQHVGQIAVEALDILIGVRDGHVVLIRVRIDNAGAELDELGVHCVVHAGGETLVVRTCALKRTFLLVVVETYIISIVSTTTAEVHIMVLANTRLEHFGKPVGVGIVHKVISAVFTQAVAARRGNTGIVTSKSEILAILLGVHHFVDTLPYLVDTEIALIAHFQRLVFLTALGRDNHHTISSTRTVDGTCRSVFQHLDGLNVIRREVADGSSHRNTVDDIQRSSTAKRTETTNTHRGIGTWLTIGCDLHTGNFTFEHRRDVRVGNTLQLVGIHNRNRTSQVGLLLSTITHDNHLVEGKVVSLKLDLADYRAATHGHLIIFETHITDHKSGISRSFQLEVSVKVGHSTC